jgi:hypothetical protein
LHFQDEFQCFEAVAIMNNLVQQYQSFGDRDTSHTSSEPNAAIRQLASESVEDEEDFTFTRAIVVEAYTPKTKGELSLNVQDMV